MRKSIFGIGFIGVCVCCVYTASSASAQIRAVGAAADTPQSAALRGGGIYLQGMGWYNLSTAKAHAVYTDTELRWAKELRAARHQYLQEKVQTEKGKKLKDDERKRRLEERQRQLRTDPTEADVTHGDALNALLYDLTDPDITTEQWAKLPVPLAAGTSVRRMLFQFVSASGSSKAALVLSRGVIALARLDTAGNWPTFLEFKDLEREKGDYEKAYGKVKDQILSDKFSPESVGEMDKAIEALKSKVKLSVPAERGYRIQAERFVEDLKESTRMFDAQTVDYAKEMLVDTKDHDATTVAELVAFTRKYRLQFASAERSPSGPELYQQLYEAMKKQLQLFETNASSKPFGSTQEIDRIAQGKWIRLVDLNTKLPDPKKMKFKNDVLEIDSARLDFPGLVANDVILRAKVRKVSGKNLFISVRNGAHWRVSEGFRGLEKDGSGTFLIWLVHTDAQKGVLELSNVHLPAPSKSDQFVDLALAAAGNRISIYVNGDQVASVTDERPKSGGLCLGAVDGMSQFKDVEYQILGSGTAK